MTRIPTRPYDPVGDAHARAAFIACIRALEAKAEPRGYRAPLVGSTNHDPLAVAASIKPLIVRR